MVEITKEKSKENLKMHLSKLTSDNNPEAPSFMEKFINLEVTHTFAESRDGGETYIWRKIFLHPNSEHRGLLSYEYRKKNKLLYSNENEPKGVAANFGLNEYVFAYLGSHESYYAGKKDENIPAFGVFISKKIEEKNTSNASRRDLASPEILESIKDLSWEEEKEHIKTEFFVPEDARIFIAYEISQKYNGDIWDYWGNLEYVKVRDNYLNKMWERKAEIHFFEKVQIDDIKGIIWPVKKYRINGGGSDSSYHIEQIMDFAEKYPRIKIYQYDWTPKYGHKAFLNASYHISKHFFDNGEYPENQIYKI